MTKATFQGKIRRWLGFWVTADLATDLQALARRRGVPLSELLRGELAPLFNEARKMRGDERKGTV